jgi:hypothetical protein
VGQHPDHLKIRKALTEEISRLRHAPRLMHSLPRSPTDLNSEQLVAVLNSCGTFSMAGERWDFRLEEGSAVEEER